MPKDVLFDSEKYIEPDLQLRLNLPEALGRTAGIFMNTTRYVEIMLAEDAHTLFVSITRGEDFTSVGYAEGTDFEDDFVHWKPTEPRKTDYQGYLVGFPLIQSTSGEPERCLHFWENNSDIELGNYALPLRSLARLVVYSQFRTDLEAERDELAHDDRSSNYQVPLLFDRRTGKMHLREATYEDVETLINTEMTANVPTLVYGKTKPGQRYIYPKPEALKTLLD